jgi:hypothetical protein
MFVGHFGVGFAAKRYTPHTNLGLLVLAGEFIDLLWPILVLLGVERVLIQPDSTPVTPLSFVYYPWTHSFLMAIVWGVVLAAIYYGFKRDKRAALVLVVVVASHWILDYLTHIPDLPLFPGEAAKFGLGLWHSRLWTAIVELGIFFGGIALYVRSTQARDRIGSIGLVVYVVFLALLYTASLQGAPPPSVFAMALTTIIGFPVFFFCAGWIDRHREPRIAVRNQARSAGAAR